MNVPPGRGGGGGGGGGEGRWGVRAYLNPYPPRTHIFKAFAPKDPVI